MSLLLLPALGAGCLPSGDDIIVVDERFEGCVACRWTIDGQVEQVTSIHPGEHALRFLAPTTMTLPATITIWDDYGDGHWLEYSSSCGGAPELWIQPVVGGWHVFAGLPMIAGGAPGGFERRYANLPPIPRDESSGATIVALSVIVDDPRGPCAIDNLRVALRAPEYD